MIQGAGPVFKLFSDVLKNDFHEDTCLTNNESVKNWDLFSS